MTDTIIILLLILTFCGLAVVYDEIKAQTNVINNKLETIIKLLSEREESSNEQEY